MLGIAGKDFMGNGEALAIDDEPNDDLFAVGAMITGMTTLRLGVMSAKTLEVRRCEIVKIDGRVEIKQAALARHELGLDGSTMGMQFVEHAVEPIFIKGIEVNLEDVGKCRALDPSRAWRARSRAQSGD